MRKTYTAFPPLPHSRRRSGNTREMFTACPPFPHSRRRAGGARETHTAFPPGPQGNPVTLVTGAPAPGSTTNPTSVTFRIRHVDRR